MFSLLNEWCEESFLEINVGKTKALVLDTRKTKTLIPVKVNSERVTVVFNFKYLDTLIDNKLSFSDNSDLIYIKNKIKKQKKTQQRLYLLRKLRSSGVIRELLQIVYKSLVESVLTFNIVVWYEAEGKTGTYCWDGRKDKRLSVSETPVGLTTQSADCQEECVQKIFYPKCCFCFKFSGYLTCSRCGFQGSALPTL